MLLDEIREKIKNKVAAVQNDPNESESNKKFLRDIVILFNDEDKIKACPKSVITGALYYLGYPLSDARQMYDLIIAEVNKVYKYVNPDDVEEVITHSK